MTNCVDKMSIDTFLKCWLVLKWSESKWTYCKSEPSFWPGTCPDAGVAHNSRYHTAQAAMPRMSPGIFIILYFVKQTRDCCLSLSFCWKSDRAGSLDFWLTGAREVSSPVADCQLSQAGSLSLRAAPKVRGKGHEVLEELGLVRRDRGECTICKNIVFFNNHS